MSGALAFVVLVVGAFLALMVGAPYLPRLEAHLWALAHDHPAPALFAAGLIAVGLLYRLARALPGGRYLHRLS